MDAETKNKINEVLTSITSTVTEPILISRDNYAKMLNVLISKGDAHDRIF